MKQTNSNNINKEKNTFDNSIFKRRAFRSKWTKVVAVIAAITVFCTTYSLILPAAAVTNTEATNEGIYLDNQTAEVVAAADETVAPTDDAA